MTADTKSKTENSFSGLTEHLIKLPFEFSDSYLKFKPDKSDAGSLQKKRSNLASIEPAASVKEWIIFSDGRIQGEVSLELSRLERNLTELVSSFFGFKSECKVTPTNINKFHISVLCTQPSTKTQERGYNSLPLADDLPLGTFGFVLEALPSNFGINLSYRDLYCLGYSPPDFILQFPKWIRTAIGVEGFTDENPHSFNINEVFIPFSALLFSKIEVKNTERKRAVQLMQAWKDKTSEKQDIIIELDSDNNLLVVKSSNIAEVSQLSRMPMSLLKIREQVRHHHNFELDFSEGRWSAVAEYLSNIKSSENNYYLQLRASYFALMTRTPNKYLSLMRHVSTCTTELESLSARLRLASSREKKLSLLSKKIKVFAEKWPGAESDPYIGQVFSEYLGDLWRFENRTTANHCYDRALEYSGHPGRLLRKKKELFLEMGDEDNMLIVLEDLINREPRKVEVSKLLLEKTAILQKKLDIEGACSTALKALSFDRHSFCAVKALAAGLVAAEKYSEAIRVLDDFIEESHPSFSGRQQAELHAMVGGIWFSYFDAPEIAAERLSLAASLDQDRPEYLHSLANSQEALGRIEDQVKSLELYVTLMTKYDDPEKVGWANEKLNQIYASNESALGLQKALHLNKLLETYPVSLESLKNMAKSFSRAEHWKTIIEAVLNRLNEIETDWEAGKVLDYVADQAEAIAGDLDLASRCRKKALEYSFLSPNIFNYNYNFLRSSDNLKMLGNLCMRWVELGFSERMEIVRECIENNYFIESEILDQWAIQATELNHGNYDLIQHRLHAHQRNKNAICTLKLWKTVNEIDVGPLRRKRLFDSITEFLIEERHWDDMKAAFHWFVCNGEDPLQVCFEAIEKLKNRVSDFELLDFLLIVLHSGEIPNLEPYRTEEVLRTNPSHLRLYFGVMAQNALDLQQKSEYIVSAINLPTTYSPTPLEIAIINQLFGAPLASEWYGVHKASRISKIPEFESQIYFYLKYWVPLLLSEEKQFALLLLLDLMSHSIEDLPNTFASLDNIITGSESESILTKIAFLADGLDENTIRIYLSKAILDPSQKYTFLLKAVISRNPRKIIDIAIDFLNTGKVFGDQTISFTRFFETLDTLSPSFIWQGIQNVVEAIIHQDMRATEPHLRRMSFFNVRQFAPIRASFHRVIQSTRNCELADVDIIFKYLMEALDDLADDEKTYSFLKIAALDCANRTTSVSLLHRLETFTYQDPIESQMVICAAYSRLQETSACKDLAGRIYSILQTSALQTDLSKEALERLNSYLGIVEPQSKENNSATGADSRLVHTQQVESKSEDVMVGDSDSSKKVGEVGRAALNFQVNENTKILGASPARLEASNDGSIAIGEDLEATSIESRPSISASNWRELARSNLLRPQDLSVLWNQKFPNSLDHHVSVQVVAVLTGQIERLKDWHMPVWRNRNSANYPISVGARYPENQLSASLVGPMAKIFMELNHFLSLVYRERLAVNQITSHMGISLDSFNHSLVPLTWNSPIIVRSGISVVRERFDNRQLSFASLPDLGKNIYFDVKSRQIIFDEGYYHKMPPSHLFHGLLIKFWEIKTKFQIYFLLDPIKELWPIVKLLIDFLSDKKITRDVLAATICNNRELGEFLERIDFKKISFHLKEMGTFRQSDFLKTYFAMQSHLYRISAAETLDIVGLLEYLTGLNLIESEGISLHELFKSSRFFQPLFKFVLQLDASPDSPAAMEIAQ